MKKNLKTIQFCNNLWLIKVLDVKITMEQDLKGYGSDLLMIDSQVAS